jgi:L,D-transpeptidase YcbB
MIRTLLALVLLGVRLPQQSPLPSAAESLRARLEQIHDAPATPVHGVRLKQADAVAHFFEARGFEPAWRAPDAPARIRAAIVDIERDGLRPSDYHLQVIDALLRDRPSASLELDLEILLTDAVAAMIDEVRFGRVRPVSLDRRWNIDPRQGSPPLPQTLADVARSPKPDEAIDALKPTHFIYQGLARVLADLRRIAAAGGWPAVPSGAAIKPGASDPRIPVVRRRLAASGEFTGDPGAAGTAYDDALVQAIMQFQHRHRLTADGTIGRGTIEALNVSADARISQTIVNLERARWVIGGLSDSFVLVNLPAFKAYLIKDRRNVWETRTQIGREARQTPAFRADMRYLVFNPDWTVPPTILAHDVLDGMRRGENPVARKHLMIIDRQGQEVDPSTIDWSKATPRNFPYTLRQPPAADNALGRVKFIFPNEHSIFLHDTPSRELFAADRRTFSSGCIRVENPLDLAALLLKDQGWDHARVQQAVDSTKSQTVLLDKPLPVLIVYWTVSVGASGEAHFASDVYNLDPAVMRALK